MDISQAREVVRSVQGSIELMYADGLSPVLVARRAILALRDGITDPTALCRTLNSYIDPYFAAGAASVCQSES